MSMSGGLGPSSATATASTALPAEAVDDALVLAAALAGRAGPVEAVAVRAGGLGDRVEDVLREQVVVRVLEPALADGLHPPIERERLRPGCRCPTARRARREPVALQPLDELLGAGGVLDDDRVDRVAVG
jgi:hypothetical protein